MKSRLPFLAIGLFFLYLGIKAISTGSALGGGVVRLPINPTDHAIEFWFVVAIDLLVGFFSLKYALFNKA